MHKLELSSWYQKLQFKEYRLYVYVKIYNRKSEGKLYSVLMLLAPVSKVKHS